VADQPRTWYPLDFQADVAQGPELLCRPPPRTNRSLSESRARWQLETFDRFGDLDRISSLAAPQVRPNRWYTHTLNATMTAVEPRMYSQLSNRPWSPVSQVPEQQHELAHRVAHQDAVRVGS